MTEPGTNDESGFALIETIVAFVILATALAVAVETISQSVKTVQRARDLDMASRMLDQLKIGSLFKVSQPGVSGGEASTDPSQMVAVQISDGHARPLFGVTVTLRPRGEAGPRFTYRTFASGAVEP